MVQVADEAAADAIAKREGETEHEPQKCADAEAGHDLHEHRERVLALDDARLRQAKSRRLEHHESCGLRALSRARYWPQYAGIAWC